VAGGFRATWSWRVGRDGLLYVLGFEAEDDAPPAADDVSEPDAIELRELIARPIDRTPLPWMTC
jgi:hypothetical protein